MKSGILFVLFIFSVILITVLIAVPNEAKAQSSSRLVQHTGYCVGLYPSSIASDASTDIKENANKINACIDEQQDFHQKVVNTFAKYTNEPSEIMKVYNKCGWKSYDPHYLNMEKLYTCIKTIIDKKMQI